MIARLGADPPRRFLEACGIVFPKGSTALYPEVGITYESDVPGLFVIGALAGYPLIKHCMNQGYEVVETIAGHPVVPADEPLLEDKLVGMPGRLAVADALDEIKAKVQLFQGLTTLQLREFLLDSEMHVRLAGEVIFEHNGFANTVFCIVSGTVEIELRDDRQPDAPPRLAHYHEGDFFGEAGLVSGRRRAGTARAGTDCVLIELARRSALKLLELGPGGERAVRADHDRAPAAAGSVARPDRGRSGGGPRQRRDHRVPGRRDADQGGRHRRSERLSDPLGLGDRVATIGGKDIVLSYHPGRPHRRRDGAAPEGAAPGDRQGGDQDRDDPPRRRGLPGAARAASRSCAPSWSASCWTGSRRRRAGRSTRPGAGWRTSWSRRASARRPTSC